LPINTVVLIQPVMEKTKLLTPGGGDVKKTELPDYGGAQSQFTNNGTQSVNESSNTRKRTGMNMRMGS